MTLSPDTSTAAKSELDIMGNPLIRLSCNLLTLAHSHTHTLAHTRTHTPTPPLAHTHPLTHAHAYSHLATHVLVLHPSAPLRSAAHQDGLLVGWAAGCSVIGGSGAGSALLLAAAN